MNRLNLKTLALKNLMLKALNLNTLIFETLNLKALIMTTRITKSRIVKTQAVKTPKLKALALVCMTIALTACGSFKTVTQTEETTYLQLVGDPRNAVLTLNEATQVDLSAMESFDLNGKQVTKIAIPAGQHRISISRNGTLLVDRKIYVSEGNAFEITLP